MWELGSLVTWNQGLLNSSSNSRDRRHLDTELRATTVLQYSHQAFPVIVAVLPLLVCVSTRSHSSIE